MIKLDIAFIIGANILNLKRYISIMNVISFKIYTICLQKDSLFQALK